MANSSERRVIQVDADYFLDQIRRMFALCRPVEVDITCEDDECIVEPLRINTTPNQVIRFNAKGTAAHVYIPYPQLSATRFLVIPAGEHRDLSVAPGADSGGSQPVEYQYVVFCESCGVSCPTHEGNHPVIIVE